MRKLMLLIGILAGLAAGTSLVAQNLEGQIIYESKVNVHRSLPPDRQEAKSMIPEFRTSKDQLLFSADASLYKPLEEEEDEEIEDGDGMRVRMRSPQNEFYFNQSESRVSILQEFMGKKYLIEDSLMVPAWKLSDETREIMGHRCRKASYVDEERRQNIVVWYTDKLRPFLGPERFNTLPGAVLQVDLNEGERVITALKFEQRPVKKDELKLSGGGLKTTRAEFRKIRDEQMERMRANGANVIIRN